MIDEVNAPLSVTVLPVISVTLNACPLPRSNTSPGPIPVVSVTSTVVSPISALEIRVVDAAAPPDPVTAVICVPLLTPVPLSGAPICGLPEVNPIVVLPRGVIKLVVMVPELPPAATEKLGDPTADPV